MSRAALSCPRCMGVWQWWHAEVRSTYSPRFSGVERSGAGTGSLERLRDAPHDHAEREGEGALRQGIADGRERAQVDDDRGHVLVRDPPVLLVGHEREEGAAVQADALPDRPRDRVVAHPAEAGLRVGGEVRSRDPGHPLRRPDDARPRAGRPAAARPAPSSRARSGRRRSRGGPRPGSAPARAARASRSKVRLVSARARGPNSTARQPTTAWTAAARTRTTRRTTDRTSFFQRAIEPPSASVCETRAGF